MDANLQVGKNNKDRARSYPCYFVSLMNLLMLRTVLQALP